MEAFRIFKKFLKYTLLTCLILIVLAAAGTYFFQDKIIELTFKEINKHLATRIEIDPKVNLSIFEKFPEISIKIKNVRVYENIPDSEEKLAELESLYFTFNAFDFIQGKYVINNIYVESGDIKISLDAQGNPNYNILKSDSSAENNISFNLEKIVLQDVMVNYSNLSIDQNHQIYVKDVTSKLKVMEKVYYIGLKGDLFIYQIGVSGKEYFKDKALTINSEQEYYEESRLYKIHPSSLTFQGSEFLLSGFYESKDKNEIDLHLKAEKSTIANLVSLLPENINREISIYESSGNIFFEATVKGFITADQNPQVNVNFGFENASFYHPEFNKKIEKATLKGSFSNGSAQCLRTCFLKLSDINASFNGKNFVGNFELDNFENPFLKFNAAGSLDVASLVQFYPIENVTNASGILDVNLSFEGKSEDLRTSEGKERVNAAGEISVKDLNFTIESQKCTYKEFNGSFTFNKNDVLVNNLSGYIGNSDFILDGTFKNFIPKMIFDKQGMMIDARLTSRTINLDELLTVFASDNTSTLPPDANNPYPHLSDYKLKLDCDISNLTFRRLHAKNLKAELDFNQPLATVKNASLEMAGGKIKLNSSIRFISKERIELNSKTSISGIHIDSFFYVFENFNQDFLIDKNLKGEFSGDIRLFFVMNHEMDINPPSIVATIDATIVNGQLNNFAPMKSLSKLVDEKQLENIRFSELKNKVYIENEKIVIPEMEIKSNISNISVQGTHTFDQHLDYQLTVPLKNFKKKPKTDKDEAFGAIEQDKKGNSLIFLTIKGTSDNYKIAYDTKKTGKKIKEGLKKEKQEIEQIFKNKKPIEQENTITTNEYEYFDF